MGTGRLPVIAFLAAALVIGAGLPVASADPDPCLGIDADGDGVVDQPPGEGCLVVAMVVEPEKNNTVDLEFHTVHAAVLWTPALDPAVIEDVPLCFGDASDPNNRACEPVTRRGKFRDVNGDGKKDKIWKWSTPLTGIQGSDTSACMYGQTTTGLKIEGCDSMTVINGPEPLLSIDDVSVVEGSSGTTAATFTVSLSPSSGGTVSVSYATADGTATAPGDYQTTYGQVTFDPGQTSNQVTVLVNGDTTPEPDETFTVQLSGASGAAIADGSGVGAILTDDAPPSASIDDVSVVEGNSGSVIATFTVSISPPAGGPVEVSWTTADGTAVAPGDYQAVSGTLNFAGGEGSKTIGVTVFGDTDPEVSEVFYVDISSSDVLVADGRGDGTILNDDSVPAITISDVSLLEGNGGTTSIASLVVTLSNPSGATVMVSYATADGSAKAPSDYTATSGILTFAPGEVSKTVDVSISGDMLTERDESFFLNLSNASGASIADAQGKCTILNDEG
ncbi:MAG: Calx-beta domain-containing protein [Actinomycetota bacterium]